MTDLDVRNAIKLGREGWEDWRSTNAGVARPSLVEADLTESDFADYDLRGLDLSKATLRRANLSRARLANADLSFADLREADLSYVTCTQANLTGSSCANANLSAADFRASTLESADLSQAIMRRTNLLRADLSSAYLFQADLSGAIFGQTVLGDTDLTGAVGLDVAVHMAASTIDFRTVLKAPLPEVFLRGCGVPDAAIAYVRSLAEHAIEFYSCFISYSVKDQSFADRLYADLQSKGVRCWFAPADLKIGDRFRNRIDSAIRLYDRILLVLSADSIESPWVRHEVEGAIEYERARKAPVLFPIRIDDSVLTVDASWAADLRRTRHIGDFRSWRDHDSYSKSFSRLLRDLKAE